MTHPIDPLTPEHLTARNLWNDAARGDVISFLFVWERMMSRYDRQIEEAYSEIPSRDSRAWDEVFMEGEREGYDMGHDDGYKEGYKDAWEEAKDKIRIITGEQLTVPSSE